MANCPTSVVTQSPAEMIRDGFVLIGRGLSAWMAEGRRALDVARAKRDLRRLDDRHLRDIGLRRDDIDTLFGDR